MLKAFQEIHCNFDDLLYFHIIQRSISMFFSMMDIHHALLSLEKVNVSWLSLVMTAQYLKRSLLTKAKKGGLCII